MLERIAPGSILLMTEFRLCRSGGRLGQLHGYCAVQNVETNAVEDRGRCQEATGIHLRDRAVFRMAVLQVSILGLRRAGRIAGAKTPLGRFLAALMALDAREWNLISQDEQATQVERLHAELINNVSFTWPGDRSTRPFLREVHAAVMPGALASVELFATSPHPTLPAGVLRAATLVSQALLMGDFLPEDLRDLYRPFARVVPPQSIGLEIRYPALPGIRQFERVELFFSELEAFTPDQWAKLLPAIEGARSEAQNRAWLTVLDRAKRTDARRHLSISARAILLSQRAGPLSKSSEAAHAVTRAGVTCLLIGGSPITAAEIPLPTAKLAADPLYPWIDTIHVHPTDI
jgi:hypothetical protein